MPSLDFLYLFFQKYVFQNLSKNKNITKFRLKVWVNITFLQGSVISGANWWVLIMYTSQGKEEDSQGISTLLPTPSQNTAHASRSQAVHNNPGMDNFWIHLSGEQNCTWLICKSLQFFAHSCTYLWPRRQVYLNWVRPQHGAITWPTYWVRKKHTPLMIMIEENFPYLLIEEEDVRKLPSNTCTH